MENKYSDIYHRIGRLSNSNENDWFENDINEIEQLKSDIVGIAKISSLIQFIIKLVMEDTLAPSFLMILGDYEEIDEFHFDSLQPYNPFIKSFTATCYNGAINQLKNIEIEFNEEIPDSFDTREIDHEIDEGATVKINFIKNSNGKFNKLVVTYYIHTMTIED